VVVHLTEVWTVVFITSATVIYGLRHRLHTITAVHRST